MKALVLCDHDLPTFKELPAGPVDLILGCGDIQDSALLQAAKHYAVPIFAVKGNHDVDDSFPKPIVDLHLNCETFHFNIISKCISAWSGGVRAGLKVAHSAGGPASLKSGNAALKPRG